MYESYQNLTLSSPGGMDIEEIDLVPEPEPIYYGTLKNKSFDSFHLGRYECPHCDTRQQSSAALRNHIRVHTGERPFQCEICFKSFKMPHHLVDHRRTHTGERPYNCQHCDRKFVQRSNLRQHEQTMHHDEKHYPCRYCTARFNTKSELREHQRIHSEPVPDTSEFDIGDLEYGKIVRVVSLVDPHACRYCPLRFSRKYKLNAHIRSHVLDKTCIDDGDGGAPSIKSELHPSELLVTSLLETDTDSSLPISTESSSEKFKLAQKVKIECLDTEPLDPDESVTNKTYICEYCPRQFARASALKAHVNRLHLSMIEMIEKYKYICRVQYCQKRFKTEASLQIHYRVHKSLPNSAKDHKHTNDQITPQSSKIPIEEKLFSNPYSKTFVQRNSQHRNIKAADKSASCHFCYDGLSRSPGSLQIACGHCKQTQNEENVKRLDRVQRVPTIPGKLVSRPRILILRRGTKSPAKARPTGVCDQNMVLGI